MPVVESVLSVLLEEALIFLLNRRLTQQDACKLAAHRTTVLASYSTAGDALTSFFWFFDEITILWSLSSPPSSIFYVAARSRQGSDHASTQDVVDILVQLGGPRPQSPRLRVKNGGDNDGEAGNNGADSGGNKSPVTPTIVVQEEREATSMGEDAERGGDQGAPQQLSTQDSEASLLSQFPPTQEMPRAVMQSPIPLPPRGERERVEPEVDDAMRMSPPASAGEFKA